MAELKGEIAVVTGAATGIGAATARLLAGRGARVVVADIADGTGVAESCNGEAFFHRLDVTSEGDWQAVRDATRARFGDATILINNAGTVIYQPLVELNAADFRRVIDVNLVGAALGIATFAPAMVALKRGAIVNTSSTEGFRGVNSLAAYAASKWGLRGLTKVAAMELGPHGIRVNSIHPGPTDTPMSNPDSIDHDKLGEMFQGQPLARMSWPKEIASAIAFLVGPGASFMTGAEMVVDGGNTAGVYFPFLPGSPLTGDFIR